MRCPWRGSLNPVPLVASFYLKVHQRKPSPAVGISSRPLSIGNEESSPSAQDTLPPIRRGQEWVGEYDATSRTFKLLIKDQKDQAFSGLMIYMDDETETFVKGYFAYTNAESLPQEARTAAQDRGITDFEAIVRFQETNVQKQGHSDIQPYGEYIGFLGSGKIAGVYQSGERVLGRFFSNKYHIIFNSTLAISRNLLGFLEISWRLVWCERNLSGTLDQPESPSGNDIAFLKT
jgi:hypothetical protein